MPITYHCDNCDVTASSIAGWLIVSIQLIKDDPAVPVPPGGRTLETTLPDYVFHIADCRTQWLTAKGLPTA